MQSWKLREDFKTALHASLMTFDDVTNIKRELWFTRS
jgi:hypothetical protein